MLGILHPQVHSTGGIVTLAEDAQVGVRGGGSNIFVAPIGERDTFHKVAVGQEDIVDFGLDRLGRPPEHVHHAARVDLAPHVLVQPYAARVAQHIGIVGGGVVDIQASFGANQRFARAQHAATAKDLAVGVGAPGSVVFELGGLEGADDRLNLAGRADDLYIVDPDRAAGARAVFD